MCLDAKIMFITAPEANICKLEMTEYHDSYMYVGSIVYYGGHLEFQDDWQANLYPNYAIYHDFVWNPWHHKHV